MSMCSSVDAVTSATGTGPSSSLPLRSRCVRPRSVPSSGGMEPRSLLPRRFSRSRRVASAQFSPDSVPFSSLFDKSRTLRLGSPTRAGGSGPVSAFDDASNSISARITRMSTTPSCGISPDMSPFPLILMCLTWVRDISVSGRVPLSAFPDRSRRRSCSFGANISAGTAPVSRLSDAAKIRRLSGGVDFGSELLIEFFETSQMSSSGASGGTAGGAPEKSFSLASNSRSVDLLPANPSAAAGPRRSPLSRFFATESTSRFCRPHTPVGSSPVRPLELTFSMRNSRSRERSEGSRPAKWFSERSSCSRLDAAPSSPGILP
mmetsp:Transcript_2833/g.11585  ORF Transcript_2833/g.11585 Transcript_2833/m.11585 type:complete len:319 (-) Transcript_2833:1251-2207(-)